MARMRWAAFLSISVGLAVSNVRADDTCTIDQGKEFVPQHVAVSLARRADGGADARFAFFNAKLRVNTDGAPNSYHPDDPKGLTLAINNIVNGVGISRVDGASMTYGERIAIFEKFRDAGWKVPGGYRVKWQNVIAATEVGGQTVPCVFAAGSYKGYFGSLTTLKNGLTGSAAGECSVNDQLDQRAVPALVMPGGDNPLKAFGAKIGDLVLAHNPANGVTVAAVVGDAGPADNLGEGSVALNMALLNKTAQPKTYAEAKLLDTGSKKMLVAVLPATKTYELARPYSAANITARVSSWAADKGYGDAAGLVRVMVACAAAQ